MFYSSPGEQNAPHSRLITCAAFVTSAKIWRSTGSEAQPICHHQPGTKHHTIPHPRSSTTAATLSRNLRFAPRASLGFTRGYAGDLELCGGVGRRARSMRQFKVILLVASYLAGLDMSKVFAHSVLATSFGLLGWNWMGWRAGARVETVGSGGVVMHGW